MSSTKAAYAITAVRYDRERKHIDQFEVRSDNGDSLGLPTTKSRQQVISSIKSGNEYITARKNSNGNWVRGDNVSIIRVNGVEYLRTDGNSTASDNLGALTEF